LLTAIGSKHEILTREIGSPAKGVGDLAVNSRLCPARVLRCLRERRPSNKGAAPTYSGDASIGALNVTDDTHSARIALLGNYPSTFVASSDGHGGTSVSDPAALGGAQPLVTPSHA
jgi:hypothetical protein